MRVTARPPTLTKTPHSNPSGKCADLGTSGYPTFNARYGHASAVFKDKLWVTGGKVERSTFQRWDLETRSMRLADVWSSVDGMKWTPVEDLDGEYWEQNADVR